VGFTFRADGVKMAIVTDLGYMPELVKVHLRDADCLVLESNHDLEMLKVGPYPWVVKQRVLSRTGHLSNHAVSEYLADPEGFDGRARYPSCLLIFPRKTIIPMSSASVPNKPSAAAPPKPLSPENSFLPHSKSRSNR